MDRIPTSFLAKTKNISRSAVIWNAVSACLTSFQTMLLLMVLTHFGTAEHSGYFVMAYGGKRLIDEVSAMAKCELRRSGLMKEMEVSSELSYARAALRDPNALDYAIAKAANSIAGYMRHAAESNFLIPSVETPFPEIARNGSYRR